MQLTFPSLSKAKSLNAAFRAARAPVLAALACVTLLTACGSILFKRQVDLACPSKSIIDDAATRVAFREGGGLDLTDLESEVKITGIGVNCLTKVDPDTKAGVQDVAVRIAFEVTRGPANRNRQIDFEYFVAVVNNARKVLYRESFPARARLAGTARKANLSGQNIILEVPISSGQTGASYQVIAGLVLTRDELSYNRKERERQRAPIPGRPVQGQAGLPAPR